MDFINNTGFYYHDLLVLRVVLSTWKRYAFMTKSVNTVKSTKILEQASNV